MYWLLFPHKNLLLPLIVNPNTYKKGFIPKIRSHLEGDELTQISFSVSNTNGHYKTGDIVCLQEYVSGLGFHWLEQLHQMNIIKLKSNQSIE